MAAKRSRAESLGSLVSLDSRCLLYIETCGRMSHRQQERFHFYKSVGGVSNEMAVGLKFLFSFLIDLLELRAIEAETKGGRVKCQTC